MDKQIGFTLVELMIAIAVVAVLATVGLPELQTFVKNSRLTGYTNDLVGSLNYARGEAVSTGQSNIMLSPYTSVASVGWNEGWRVWIDRDNDDARASDGSEDIKEFKLDDDNVTLKAEVISTACATGTSATFFDDFGFFATGLLNAGASNDCVRFSFCDDRSSEDKRRITVRRTGRVVLNVIKPTNAAYSTTCQ